MQREVEALIRAYHDEKRRETRLVQDVLTALAAGQVSRRLMIVDLTAALARASGETASVSANFNSDKDDEIASFVRRVRSATAH